MILGSEPKPLHARAQAGRPGHAPSASTAGLLARIVTAPDRPGRGRGRQSSPWHGGRPARGLPGLVDGARARVRGPVRRPVGRSAWPARKPGPMPGRPWLFLSQPGEHWGAGLAADAWPDQSRPGGRGRVHGFLSGIYRLGPRPASALWAGKARGARVAVPHRSADPVEGLPPRPLRSAVVANDWRGAASKTTIEPWKYIAISYWPALGARGRARPGCSVAFVSLIVGSLGTF